MVPTTRCIEGHWLHFELGSAHNEWFRDYTSLLMDPFLMLRVYSWMTFRTKTDSTLKSGVCLLAKLLLIEGWPKFLNEVQANLTLEWPEC